MSAGHYEECGLGQDFGKLVAKSTAVAMALSQHVAR